MMQTLPYSGEDRSMLATGVMVRTTGVGFSARKGHSHPGRRLQGRGAEKLSDPLG